MEINQTFIENLKEAAKEEKIKRQNILNNAEYMDNLIKKLKVYSYVLEETGEKERVNTYKDLALLYKIVNEYARDNNLCPVSQNYYDVYYLRYNNYMFMIYKNRNNKAITYGCYPSYLKDDYLPYIIEFEDIRKGKDIDINKGLILELRNVLERLIEEGFSIYFVQQLVDDMIDNIREEKGREHSR